MTLAEFDRQYQAEGVQALCGVDEAGRGPLAGAVYAAAVILPPECSIEGINDSKKLTAKKRELLYSEIVEQAVAFCVASASEAEIDEINILNAALLAMKRAVEGLPVAPDLVLVDGNRAPELACRSEVVTGGDEKSACIAAASILAKVERDRYMAEVAERYPEYRFEQHKGYPTKLHYEMLDAHGPSAVHRRTFLRKWEARR